MENNDKSRIGPDPFRVSVAVSQTDRDYDYDDEEEYHGPVIYRRRVDND